MDKRQRMRKREEMNEQKEERGKRTLELTKKLGEKVRLSINTRENRENVDRLLTIYTK